jgi:hypothetical protein
MPHMGLIVLGYLADIASRLRMTTPGRQRIDLKIGQRQKGHSKNRKGSFTKLLNGKGPVPLLSYLGSNNAL